MRAALCRKLGWLGMKLDPQANASGGPRISTADSGVSVWVIPTNEELMIAQHTLELLGRSSDAAQTAKAIPRTPVARRA